MERNCPACNSSNKRRLGEKLGFNFCICTHCGSLYTLQEPQPGSEQDYEDYGGYGKEDSIPAFIHARCDELIKPFDAYRKLNTILDVGFGAGTLLEAAGRQNWKVSGVEVSKTAADYQKKKHPEFDIHCDFLENVQYPDNSFDVVMVIEVIEHVLDPKPILKEVFRILRPGGVAWVTTPNLKSISWYLLGLHWSMITPPDHLEIYTVSGVKKLSTSCGFELKNVVTHGINPYEIINHFKAGKDDYVPSSRVSTGYELNEALVSNSGGIMAKKLVNKFLGFTRLGDGMKVLLEKPLI